MLIIENQTGVKGLIKEYNIGKTTSINKNFNKTDLNENHFLLKEGIDEYNRDKLFVDCILQKADVENKNGRIYPRHLLEREVERYNDEILMGNAFGEVNHPDESEVNLNNAPHRIIKYWWVDNVLYGTLELIVSKAYKDSGFICCVGDDIANKIFNYNAVIGISSRGVGSLEEANGKKYVQDDFEIICWDLVHSPSTANAYLFTEKQEGIIKKMEKDLNQDQTQNKLRVDLTNHSSNEIPSWDNDYGMDLNKLKDFIGQ